MFPLQNIDAVKLCLLNEPIYHGKLTPDAVSAKLQNPGDFLVQDGENSSSVLLSIFKDGIRDFLITIEKVEESPRFLVGRRCFASLEELTFNLKSVQCGSEEIRLETAIYRVNDYGRLGAHCFVDLPPRTTMKTMIPLPTIKYKSVLVALKREIIHEEIEEELESLMLLKHKHLVRLEDFAMYPHGSVILRYEMHDSTSLYDTMRKKEFGVGTTLAWVQQAASLAFYLAKKECFYSVLCAQDCYLDANQNIKFRGAWNSPWPSWQEDTLRHAFYWRHRSRSSYLEAVFSDNLNLVDPKM
ncbi:hypothetical protein ANCCEY_09067 [Ancylostoma ceylanicum]|uniref:Serine-threonine/tyrosine-protein kinase catalytic domain-containing protein n=1 Tax=Ancylostoma ceylanicum TaxID=53326 RepID=A0A0D6LIL1_9BILA|nr:hypothetical protein ANCCEY_09067 [Ancylostoma ceylanicum]